MATFSKQTFSTGASLLVSGTTSGAADALHTVPASSTDEVWMYATNNDVSAVNLTIEFGDTTATNNIKQSIPAVSGLTILVPGLVLTAAKTITVFAGTTNVITIHGYVNRIS